MTNTDDRTSCRRTRRTESHRDAIWYQLQQVVRDHALDAIVFTDDLGRQLAQAGNRELSELLAESSMWATDGIDNMTMRSIQARYPDLDEQHVITESIACPGGDGTRVIGAGRSVTHRFGVERAAHGIRRICSFAALRLGAPLFDEAASAPDDLEQIEPTGPSASGVRWQILAR